MLIIQAGMKKPTVSYQKLQISPVLQRVLNIVVRTRGYLIFSLLVFSFSCLLKKEITFNLFYCFSKNQKI